MEAPIRKTIRRIFTKPLTNGGSRPDTSHNAPHLRKVAWIELKSSALSLSRTLKITACNDADLSTRPGPKDLCYTRYSSLALEQFTIGETRMNNTPRKFAIFIVALLVTIPLWAKNHVQQSTLGMASPGTGLQRSSSGQMAQAECGTSDFTFSELRAQSAGYGFTRIMGRITNHCTEAKGAQIKITTYNRAGDILSDDDIWPAGIDNIPANTEFPFEWIDTKAVFARFTVTIISVKAWPQRN
jgi:hypothetical protein